MDILIGIGGYFILGVVVLVLFDLITKRIRNRLSSASHESRDRLLESGTPVGTREATALTVGALWLFWPLVIFIALQEALQQIIRGGSNGKER